MNLQNEEYEEEDELNPVIPIPGFVDAYCEKCRRRTQQINGRCRWCLSKPNNNRPIELTKNGSIKNIRSNVRTAFYNDCPKCGNKKIAANPTCANCKKGLKLPKIGLDYFHRERVILNHKIKIANMNIARWKQQLAQLNQK